MDIPYEYFLGIDPGLTGALGVLGRDGFGAAAFTMPTIDANAYSVGRTPTAKLPDTLALAELIREHMPCHVAIERLGPGGLKSKLAAFSLGSSAQACLDAARIAGADYVLVSPREWQKLIPDYYRNENGTASKSSSRNGEEPPSVKFASERWHRKVLRRTERCKTADHNRADALCIALWGRRYALDRIHEQGVAWSDALG